MDTYSGVATVTEQATYSINFQDVKNAAETINAVNDPVRRDILALVEKAAPIKFGDIFRKLRIPESLAYQQVRLLRDTNIILSERQGLEVYCRINLSRIEKISAAAIQLMNEINNDPTEEPGSHQL